MVKYGRLKTVSRRTDFEQRLAEFDRLAVLNQDLGDDTFDLGLDFVHHLHRLDDANDRFGIDLRADFNIRRRIPARVNDKKFRSWAI